MGSKKSKPKVKKVTSPFSGVQSYNVDLPGIASGSSSISGGQQKTTGALSDPFQKSLDLSNQVYQNNSNYLNRSPDQQYNDLLSGNNAYYNAQKAVFDRNITAQQSALQKRYSRAGLENATTTGAAQATLNNDAALMDSQLQNNALAYQNQQAIQNAASGLQGVNQYSNIAFMPAQLSNQNLYAGNNANLQASMFNAQAQNQANMAEYQQGQSNPWAAALGQALGVGTNLALAAAGVPVFGGGGSSGGASGGQSMVQAGYSPSNFASAFQPMTISQPQAPAPVFSNNSMFGQYANQNSPYIGKVFG